MILITGGTGMVGQHLLAELVKRDKPIKALFRTEEKRDYTLKQLSYLLDETHHKKLTDIEWFKADITDFDLLTKAFEDVTEVYHCAGLVSFDIRDRDKLNKVNIGGTANMVKIALKSNVKKFCHFSSVAALGSEINGEPINEETKRSNLKPYNNYNLSKYGAEKEVWKASQKGLPVVVINPGIIIGPGNWTSGSGRLFYHVAKDFPIRVPGESGFVGVNDVVIAMIKLMESSIKNERFILVSEVKSTADLMDQIAESLDSKPPKYTLTKWMAYSLWILQSIGHLILRTKKEITLEDIDGFFKKINFDNSKITKQTNFHYTPISVAIEKTAQHYLREHQPIS